MEEVIEPVNEWCVCVNGVQLAIITWAEVLERLRQTAASSAAGYVSDIWQLEGYCAQMDSDAFIPFSAEELTAETAKKVERYYEIIDETVERLSPAAFRKVTGKDKVISANVEFYSGLVYEMLGIPEDLFTPMFAVSRIAGWCAHRIEELTTGGRIMRPAYRALPVDQKYVPLDER